MKTKIGDLLTFVADQPLNQFSWHIALIHHLNLGVIETHQIQATQTGREILADVLLRGTDAAMLIVNSSFNTEDGTFHPPEEPESPAVLITVPAVPTEAPAPAVVIQNQPQGTNRLGQVIVIIVAIAIVLLALMLSMLGGRDPTTGKMVEGHERVIGQAIQTLGDIALQEQKNAAEEAKAREKPVEHDPPIQEP